MYELSKKAARAGANGLSIARGAAGPWLARELYKTPPDERGWELTKRVAALVVSDKVDGVFGRYAEPSKLGPWLDQMADKAFVLPPMIALTKAGEIEPRHVWIKASRDIGVTALRSAVHLNGGATAAENIGKLKATVEMAGLLVASSPLAAEYPNLTNRVFEASSALNIVSGVHYAEALGSFTVAALRGEGQEGLGHELAQVFSVVKN